MMCRCVRDVKVERYRSQSTAWPLWTTSIKLYQQYQHQPLSINNKEALRLKIESWMFLVPELQSKKYLLCRDTEWLWKSFNEKYFSLFIDFRNVEKFLCWIIENNYAIGELVGHTKFHSCKSKGMDELIQY